jgi:hypothetical protein
MSLGQNERQGRILKGNPFDKAETPFGLCISHPAES